MNRRQLPKIKVARVKTGELSRTVAELSGLQDGITAAVGTGNDDATPLAQV